MPNITKYTHRHSQISQVIYVESEGKAGLGKNRPTPVFKFRKTGAPRSRINRNFISKLRRGRLTTIKRLVRAISIDLLGHFRKFSTYPENPSLSSGKFPISFSQTATYFSSTCLSCGSDLFKISKKWFWNLLFFVFLEVHPFPEFPAMFRRISRNF